MKIRPVLVTIVTVAVLVVVALNYRELRLSPGSFEAASFTGSPRNANSRDHRPDFGGGDLVGEFGAGAHRKQVRPPEQSSNSRAAETPSAGPAAPSSSPIANPPASYPVDGILDRLAQGNMAFRRPPSMIRGESKVVDLLVSQTAGLEELTRQLRAQAKGDVVEGHALRIAPTMQAHLTGAAFDITPITPEEQPISATESTEWKWEIRPRDFGHLPLHLAVNALVTLDGQQRTRTLRTFDETVTVNVSWTESVLAFVNEHVEWLLTGVLVPVIAWLVARWHRRRKKRQQQAFPPAAGHPGHASRHNRPASAPRP